MGKPEGKRPLGRPRHRWKNNIKMDLQEVGCGGKDWIDWLFMAWYIIKHRAGIKGVRGVPPHRALKVFDTNSREQNNSIAK
jgi:hypothetical protein